MSSARYTATRTSLRTAAIMVGFTAIFTAIMAFTFDTTRPAIEAARVEEQMRLIDEVLPRDRYDNLLLEDFVDVGPHPALAGNRVSRIWRARKAGQPVALIAESSAPDGYAGRIELIVAIHADGTVSGVRVTAHKETPGLGDYVDPRKDRNKARPWISQFVAVDWNTIEASKWTVRKDGGVFDYHTGATISARAVTRAVGRTVGHVVEQRDALFAAPSASRL